MTYIKSKPLLTKLCFQTLNNKIITTHFHPKTPTSKDIIQKIKILLKSFHIKTEKEARSKKKWNNKKNKNKSLTCCCDDQSRRVRSSQISTIFYLGIYTDLPLWWLNSHVYANHYQKLNSVLFVKWQSSFVFVPKYK